MRYLHILRSEPDDQARALIDEISGDNEQTQVALYSRGVDYDALVQQVFDNDKVICWW
jgi:hypothetical protein